MRKLPPDNMRVRENDFCFQRAATGILMSVFFILFTASLAFLVPAGLCHAKPLSIINSANRDILNIRVAPVQGEPFFWRLDLAPGARDSVENPDQNASLRVDTGMQLQFYENVPLASLSELIFCGEHPACITAAGTEKPRHIQAKTRDLVPQAGDRPVCSLEGFKPGMTMREVCDILEPNLPRDDNGAILTGLGFAGLTWASRLAPAQNGPITENSLLEHLELRRPLTLDNIQTLMAALRDKGCVPWQAELPGLEIDFSEMPSDADHRQKALTSAISEFLQKASAKRIGANPQDAEPEASIIMAPEGMLSSLANSDAPEKDVQIYTINLKPASETLLLDVAAYKGEKEAN